jgi:hypothetical protein
MKNSQQKQSEIKSKDYFSPDVPAPAMSMELDIWRIFCFSGSATIGPLVLRESEVNYTIIVDINFVIYVFFSPNHLLPLQLRPRTKFRR